MTQRAGVYHCDHPGCTRSARAHSEERLRGDWLGWWDRSIGFTDRCPAHSGEAPEKEEV